jgi:serine/arginine repetitive matrix protein 2
MHDATPPSLSRRFTLLRASSGDPVPIDSLKSRFAEQRARGAENHLSEEEEDMFLQTIGRLRSKPSSSSTSGDSTHGLARDSLRSGDTPTSSVTSSPASTTKRYSNNMFGSGKLRDYTYLRSVAKERAGKPGAGRRSASSTAFSTISRSGKSSDTSILEDSSQTDPDPPTHDSDATPLASGIESSAAELEQGIVKSFQPGHLRRASMALDEVIREIEEEAEGDGDDKILIPRSPAPERASGLNRRSVSGCVDGIILLSHLISRLRRTTSPL